MKLTLSPHALARWIWLKGQSLLDDDGVSRLVVAVHDNVPFVEDQDGYHTAHIGPHKPDLSDPVTAACLPMVVREAWKQPWFHARHSLDQCDDGVWRRRWWVTTNYGDGHNFTDENEGCAWVKALEAAL